MNKLASLIFQKPVLGPLKRLYFKRNTHQVNNKIESSSANGGKIEEGIFSSANLKKAQEVGKAGGALIGVGAACVSSIYGIVYFSLQPVKENLSKLENKVEKLEKKVDTGLEKLEKRIDTGLEKVNNKIEGLNVKMEVMSIKMENIASLMLEMRDQYKEKSRK